MHAFHFEVKKKNIFFAILIYRCRKRIMKHLETKQDSNQSLINIYAAN